jgi:phospholipid transport system transporter-binding protein
VVLDASDLVDFDSSALAVLLGLRRVLSQRGSALHIAGMTPRLRELAALYGVLELLHAD